MNLLELKEQKDGTYILNSDHKEIPLEVVNELLNNFQKILEEKHFNKAFATIDEKHKEYTDMLFRESRKYKFLHFLFFGTTVFFLLLWLTSAV